MLLQAASSAEVLPTLIAVEPLAVLFIINVLCPAIEVIVFYARLQNPLLRELDKECLYLFMDAAFVLVSVGHVVEAEAADV